MMIEIKKLNELLKSLNIPVAYDHFTKVMTPPFIAYRCLAPSNFVADNKNYYISKNFEIELVTDKKDIELEEKLELLFADIPFDKEDDIWDTDERIYHIIYHI